MDDALYFLIRHGYAVLFAAVLVDQLGMPVPAAPFLVAAGALVRADRLSPAAVIGLAVLASLLGHTAWYEAGRRGGGKILRIVCGVSLEPDVCVRKTENLFARRGAKSLVFAQFIPGLAVVAQPLAGMSGVPLPRFLGFNLLAAVLWAGGFVGGGYMFARQLESAAHVALRLGGSLLLVILGALVAYLGWKVLERQRLLRQLRTARISPEELKHQMDAGEHVTIVDLRHALEFEADPRTIPGALRMAPEELDDRHPEIPRDREVVLYCT